MNKNIAVNVAKYVFAVAIGATIALIAKPSVDEFLNAKKDGDDEVTPSTDIEEDEAYMEV